jgi:hypothetical protein
MNVISYTESFLIASGDWAAGARSSRPAQTHLDFILRSRALHVGMLGWTGFRSQGATLILKWHDGEEQLARQSPQ